MEKSMPGSLVCQRTIGVIPKHVAILNVIANHILYLKYKNNGFSHTG